MKTQWTFWKKANSPGHGSRKSRDFIGSECVRMSCMDDRKRSTASSCLSECERGYVNPTTLAGLDPSAHHLHDLLSKNFVDVAAPGNKKRRMQQTCPEAGELGGCIIPCRLPCSKAHTLDRMEWLVLPRCPENKKSNRAHP